MSTSTSSYSLSPFPLPPHSNPTSTSTFVTDMTSSTASLPPPLGPLSSLPAHCEPLKRFRILLLVTSINSFTQRVISYLQYLGFEQVSVQLATSDEEMLNAAEKWDADLVLCPFLTKKLPESIYSKWITLVVHPGPPGDAGPSSLDWVLMGDDGSIPDSTEALDILLDKSTSERESTQRSHWGTICFQANEELDGGAVWAWEQYTLPPIGTITKAQLYQGYHSNGAISATIHALCRVYEQTAGSGLNKADWLKAIPKDEWSRKSVTISEAFLGGKTLDRPLLQSTKRRPNWDVHTAEDIKRILDASDSQPGSMLNPLTTNSKSSLFAYGAHLHQDLSTIPATFYTSLGYESFSAIPNGTIIATRQGAIFIKTRQMPIFSAGIWITHGRVPRGKDKPIDPKIPMTEAILAAGHGQVLEGIKEWKQTTWMERKGEWQEVFVRSLEEKDGIAQLVYWNFYNGAFSTSSCQYLLKALQWATAEERGNVKLLALMGGNYFSNGVALNTIEHASSPGAETWANINAIDDIVSFLVGDISTEVPDFLKSVKPLSQKDIATIACVRGNAAAGGVALAAACDVVMASRGVVLNPSYRGMGLHGSELHSYSYFKRCGPIHAATLLRAMKPLNTTLAHEWGLVDIEIGLSNQTLSETEPLFIETIHDILIGKMEDTSSPVSNLACAPWCKSSISILGEKEDVDLHRGTKTLVHNLCENKVFNYSNPNRDFPPLLHYRNEELSQMLLDSFHPVRSQRYHSRRYKFIRKVKPDSTPSRYILHEQNIKEDEEDTRGFDNAPGWIRGEEWKYANLPTPESMKSSEKTRIDVFYTGQPSQDQTVNQSEHKNDTVNSTTSSEHPSAPVLEEAISSMPLAQRKHSEAPTLLSERAMSNSSISEIGPSTPKLDSNSSSPTKQNASVRMQPSISTQSRRLSLFRSTSSQHSSPIKKDNKQLSTSTTSTTALKNKEEPGLQTDKKEKEKQGAFKSLRKKVKNALRSLNGNDNSSDKTKFKRDKKLHGLTPSRSVSSQSISNSNRTKSSSANNQPVRSISSTSTPSAQQRQITGGRVHANSDGLVSGPGSTSTNTETKRIEGECEWPCLTTGGEDIQEEQGTAQGTIRKPLAEEVA
ncbi:uncharacterized protein IL334_006389 [Kwoniella shivajii]|uniref:Methionyl-tRNA formyltransferase n=1 Tax=Kwoniella shivajii TaxID=564305 RepID=A0ABZ1D667_9TREE|nr:hypothetical protein IL334_006389 [Kwoniella shivajii]